jgi:hypothetical protein
MWSTLTSSDLSWKCTGSSPQNLTPPGDFGWKIAYQGASSLKISTADFNMAGTFPAWDISAIPDRLDFPAGNLGFPGSPQKMVRAQPFE